MLYKTVCQELLPDMPDNSIRLSKRISELGIASRREADAWIEKGWVKVNGEVASLGMKVSPTDRIQISSKAKKEQRAQVTVLLNKPVGYVSGQAEDGYEPAKVLITPENHWNKDDSGIPFSRSHLGRSKFLASVYRLRTHLPKTGGLKNFFSVIVVIVIIIAVIVTVSAVVIAAVSIFLRR